MRRSLFKGRKMLRTDHKLSSSSSSWVMDFDDVNNNLVLGTAPCRHEAQSALTALQHPLMLRSSRAIETSSCSHLVGDICGRSAERFMHRAMSSDSDSDWLEPSFQLFNSNAAEASGSEVVYDAFHLLQTEPSIQRMVISLSSDPAVWNAVLNNVDVQELRNTREMEDESSEEATSILKWIVNSTRTKAMEIVEMIRKLVNDLFQTLEDDKKSSTSNDFFERKVRYSLMVTVVVLLIVAVDRAKRVRS